MKVEVNGWVETREWSYEGKAFSSTSITPTEPVRILAYAQQHYQQPYGAQPQQPQAYASQQPQAHSYTPPQQPQANEVPATPHNDEIFNADDFTQQKTTYSDTSFNY